MGLIITGSGGIGKTRLTLELGRVAAEQGWLVYRVKERQNAEKLYDRLAQEIDASQNVLLLVDYAETQKDFTELIDFITTLNEDDGLHCRYVANCRTAYYSNIKNVEQLVHIDLDFGPFDTLYLEEK